VTRLGLEIEYGFEWILILVTTFFCVAIICCCYIFRACCAEEKKIRIAANLPEIKITTPTPKQKSPVRRRSIPYIERTLPVP
jgi:hypothetical protein